MMEKQFVYQRPLSIMKIVATLAKVTMAFAMWCPETFAKVSEQFRKSSFAWAGPAVQRTVGAERLLHERPDVIP
jgi:hypothetical protein